MDAKKWFKQAQFGMMVHWGLYSLIGGEWKGGRMPHIAEWAQSYFRIPNREYHQLANVFNPIYFSADEWVQTAKDSGANYLVVTSKHHDGFALFDSKVSGFTSVKVTPFGRDIIDELANACAKKNMRLGLYYSQEIDWSHPHGGFYGADYLNCGDMSWTNDWDFPDNAAKDYSICFEEKIKPQVREILTNYGDLCLIWFDTPDVITPEQSRELFDIVKHHQPDCLVNSRIGNGIGDYASTGDNEIPEDSKTDLWEAPCTLNDTWGFKYYDSNWKPAEKVLALKQHLSSRGINYLLNVGPDHLGRIPGPACDILRAVGR